MSMTGGCMTYASIKLACLFPKSLLVIFILLTKVILPKN